jgi:diguanylate cyclase (GGDEF)-like protein
MNKKILVVDDSEFARNSLRDTLNQNNYQADTVSNGKECLEKLSQQEYDLAIIDYIMPEMNGLELLQEIVNRNLQVPVIILTGKGSEEIAVQAMKLGALNYVIKTENYNEIILEVIKEDLNLYKVIELKKRLEQRKKIDPKQESLELKPKTKDRILVVDDSRFVREVLTDTLHFNNYDVDTAASGSECLEKITQEDYDLAVIDYIMPGMNGLEVLKEIVNKKHPVPVIILTGRGSEEIAVQAMKLGALDYVIKAIGHMQVLPDIIRDNLYMYRSALTIEIEKGIVSVKEKILVVDDCLTVQEKVHEVLSSKNYEVDIASSGSECLAKLAEKKYDLLLIDYMMPDMNGLEVLQEIINKKYEVPPVIITGRGTEEIAVRAMKLGAFDYVIKTVGYLESLPEVVMRNLRMHRINKEKELLEKKLIEKNKDLENRIKQLRALNEISKNMGESLDLNKTLMVIVSQIVALINCSRITIMLLDTERQYLTIKAAKGFPEEEAAKVKVKITEGISGYVAAQGEPIFISNIEEDPRFKKRNSEQYFAKSLISVPLKIRDEVIGVVNVNNKLDNDPFTIDDCDILMTISYNAAIAIENSRRYEEAKISAIKDALTGLFNQAHFWKVLDIEMERAMRYKNALSLVIIDVDDFKKVNDTYGHQQGDMVLAELGGALLKSIRKPDILFRYGGEEFVIILTQTDIGGAQLSAERLRATIEKHQFSSETLKDLKVTISLGIVQYKKDMSQKEIFENADKALYEAKQKGKNCYCITK